MKKKEGTLPLILNSAKASKNFQLPNIDGIFNIRDQLHSNLNRKTYDSQKNDLKPYECSSMMLRNNSPSLEKYRSN